MVYHQPLDTTAFDPDDSQAMREIARRAREGDFQVSASEMSQGDPLAVRRHRATERFEPYPIMMSVGSFDPAAPPLVAQRFSRKLRRGEPPESEQRARELERQLRLSLMAERNGATYGRNPALTPTAETLLKDYPEIWGRMWMREVLPWTHLVDSLWADGDFPAAWGNLACFWNSTGIPERDLFRPSWCQSYLAIRLPQALPPLALDSRAVPSLTELTLGPDSVSVSVDPDFDRNCLMGQVGARGRAGDES